jgi:NADPH oxidase 5
MNLRKVDFFWINRDQRSFEWFVQLLSQLEIEQAESGSAMDRFLDMVTESGSDFILQSSP